MLKNLDDTRRKKGVTLNQMGELLDVKYQTVSDKINGVYEFKFGEALAIRDEFFPEYSLEYLFKKDDIA